MKIIKKNLNSRICGPLYSYFYYHRGILILIEINFLFNLQISFLIYHIQSFSFRLLSLIVVVVFFSTSFAYNLYIYFFTFRRLRNRLYVSCISQHFFLSSIFFHPQYLPFSVAITVACCCCLLLIIFIFTYHGRLYILIILYIVT